MTLLAIEPRSALPLSDRLRRGLRRLLRSYEISAQRRALEQVPDYLLRDMGISRCDIDFLAQAAVDGASDPTRVRRLPA